MDFYYYGPFSWKTSEFQRNRVGDDLMGGGIKYWLYIKDYYDLENLFKTYLFSLFL